MGCKFRKQIVIVHITQNLDEQGLCDLTPACNIATLSDRLSSSSSNSDTSIALKVIGGRLARSEATNWRRVAAPKGIVLISLNVSLRFSSPFFDLFSV